MQAGLSTGYIVLIRRGRRGTRDAIAAGCSAPLDHGRSIVYDMHLVVSPNITDVDANSRLAFSRKILVLQEASTPHKSALVGMHTNRDACSPGKHGLRGCAAHTPWLTQVDDRVVLVEHLVVGEKAISVWNNPGRGFAVVRALESKSAFTACARGLPAYGNSHQDTGRASKLAHHGKGYRWASVFPALTPPSPVSCILVFGR